MTKTETIAVAVAAVSLVVTSCLAVVVHQQQNYIESLSHEITAMQDDQKTFMKKEHEPLKSEVEHIKSRLFDLDLQISDVSDQIDDAHARIDDTQSDVSQAQWDAYEANRNAEDAQDANESLRTQLNNNHRNSYYY